MRQPGVFVKEFVMGTNFEDLSIKELKAIINEADQKMCGVMRKGIKEHVLPAGFALLEIKSRHAHGEWVPWLKENFRGSYFTAQRYMRVAKHWDEIKDIRDIL
jgi:hypothetical protein